MITATGLNCIAFKELNELFEKLYNNNTPHTTGGIIMVKKNIVKGRKRLVSSETCLGLVLMWTRTRGSQMVLQMIFGIVQATIGVYLRYGRRVLAAVLCNDPDAKFAIPSVEKIKGYQS